MISPSGELEDFTSNELAVIDTARQRFVDSATTDEDKLIRLYQCFPEKFIEQVIGVNEENGFRITEQQHQLLNAVGRLSFCKKLSWDFSKAGTIERLPRAVRKYAKKLGISIRSGRGVGKSATCSWLIYWFACTHNACNIPCVGPSEKVLKTVLFGELNNWFNRRNPETNDYIFKEEFRKDIALMASELRMHNNPKWRAHQIVSPRNADLGTLKGALGGQHADNQMFIFDEMNSIPDAVFEPLEGTNTGRCNFMIGLFNPTRSSGYAFNSHYHPTQSRDFIRLHWNGEESDIISKDYLETLETRYGGRDNNVYKTSVIGVPPSSEDGSLIPLIWVDDAIARTPPPREFNERSIIFGIDVARSGGDATVVCIRQGYHIIDFVPINIVNTIDQSIEILKLAKKWNAEYICVDSVGIGGAIYDALHKTFPKVYAVEVSRSARNKNKYKSLRDELYFGMRHLFEESLVSIPDNEELRIQLSTIKYENQMGYSKIEGKKEMRKRLGGDSPDYADALMISMYIDDFNKAIIREEDLEDPYDRMFREGFDKQLSKRSSWMSV